MTPDEIRKLLTKPEISKKFNELAAKVPPEQRGAFFRAVYQQLSQLPSPVVEAPPEKEEKPKTIKLPVSTIITPKPPTPTPTEGDIAPQFIGTAPPPTTKPTTIEAGKPTPELVEEYEKEKQARTKEKQLEEAYEKAIQSLQEQIPEIAEQVRSKAKEALLKFSSRNHDLPIAQVGLNPEALSPPKLLATIEAVVYEGRLQGRDVSSLVEYMEPLQDIEDLEKLRGLQKEKGIKGVAAGLMPRTLADYLRLIPIVGTLYNASEIKEFKQLADKVEKGTATGEELNALVLKTLKKHEETQLPFWVKTGETIRNMIPYMAEFALAKATAPVKIATKGIPGVVLKSAVMTASPVGMLRVAERTAQYMSPAVNFALDPETDNLVLEITKGDNFIEALPKGFARVALEMGTEQAGELVAPALATTKKAILGKWLADKKLLGKTGEIIAPIAQVIDAFKKSGGWHGVIGEVGEEELDAFLSSLLGLEMPGEKKYHPIDPERWASEFAPISIFGFLTGLPANVGGILEANAKRTVTADLLKTTQEKGMTVAIKTRQKEIAGKVSGVGTLNATITTEQEDIKVPLLGIEEIKVIDPKPNPVLAQTIEEIREATPQEPPTTPEQQVAQAPPPPAPPQTETEPTTPPPPSLDERIFNTLKKMNVAELTPGQQIEVFKELEKIPQPTDEQISNILSEVLRPPPRLSLEEATREIPFEPVEKREEAPPETPPETKRPTIEIPEIFQKILGPIPKEVFNKVSTLEQLINYPVVEITETKGKSKRTVTGRFENYTPSRKLINFRTLDGKPKKYDENYFKLPNVIVKVDWEIAITPTEPTKEITTEDILKILEETPEGLTRNEIAQKLNTSTQLIGELLGRLQNTGKAISRSGMWLRFWGEKGDSPLKYYPQGKTDKIAGMPDSPTTQYYLVPLSLIQTSFSPDIPAEVKKTIQGRVESPAIAEQRIAEIIRGFDPKVLFISTAEGIPIISELTAQPIGETTEKTPATRKFPVALTNLRLEMLKKLPDTEYNEYIQELSRNLPQFFEGKSLEEAQKFINDNLAEGNRVVMVRHTPDIAENPKAIRDLADALNIPLTRQHTTAGVVGNIANTLVEKGNEINSLYAVVETMGAGEFSRFTDAKGVLTDEGTKIAQMALIQAILLKGLGNAPLAETIATRIFMETPPLGLKIVQSYLLSNALDFWQYYNQEVEVARQTPGFSSTVLATLLAIDYCFEYATRAGHFNYYLSSIPKRKLSKVTAEISSEINKQGIKDITTQDVVAIMMGAQLIPGVDAETARFSQDFLDGVLEKHKEIAEQIRTFNDSQTRRQLMEKYGAILTEQISDALHNTLTLLPTATGILGDMFAEYNTTRFANAYLIGAQKFLNSTFPQLNLFDRFPPGIRAGEQTPGTEFLSAYRIAVAIGITPKKETSVWNLFNLIKKNIEKNIVEGMAGGRNLFEMEARTGGEVATQKTEEAETKFQNAVVKILAEKETAGLVFISRDGAVEVYPLEIGSPTVAVSLMGLIPHIKKISEIKKVFTYHSHPEGQPAKPSEKNILATKLLAQLPLAQKLHYGGELIIAKSGVRLLTLDKENKIKVSEISDITPQVITREEFHKLLEFKNFVIGEFTTEPGEKFIISFPPDGLFGVLLNFKSGVDVRILTPERMSLTDREMLEYWSLTGKKPVTSLRQEIYPSEIKQGMFVEIYEHTEKEERLVAVGRVTAVKIQKNKGEVEVTLGKKTIPIPLQQLFKKYSVYEFPALVASALAMVRETFQKTTEDAVSALKHIWGGEILKQLGRKTITLKLGRETRQYNITGELARKLQDLHGSPSQAIGFAISSGVVRAINNLDNVIGMLTQFSPKAQTAILAILNNWLSGKIPPVWLWEKIIHNKQLTPEEMKKLNVKTDNPKEAAKDLGLDTSSPANFFKMPFANYPFIQAHFSYSIQKEIMMLLESLNVRSDFVKSIDEFNKIIVAQGEKDLTPQQRRLLAEALATGSVTVLQDSEDGRRVLELLEKWGKNWVGGPGLEGKRAGGKEGGQPALDFASLANQAPAERTIKLLQILAQHYRDLKREDIDVLEFVGRFDTAELEVICKALEGEEITENDRNALRQLGGVYANKDQPEIAAVGLFEKELANFITSPSISVFGGGDFAMGAPPQEKTRLEKLLKEAGIDVEQLGRDLKKQGFISLFTIKLRNAVEKTKELGKQFKEQIVMPYWYNKMIDDILRLQREFGEGFVHAVERALLDSGFFALSVEQRKKVVSALMLEDAYRIHLTNDRPDLLNSVLGLGKQEFAAVQKLREALTLGMDYYEKAALQTVYIAELFPQIKTLVEAWMRANNKTYNPELIYDLYHLLINPHKALNIKAEDPRLLGYVRPLTIRQAYEKARKFASDIRRQVEVKTPISFDGEKYYVETPSGQRIHHKDINSAIKFAQLSKLPLVYHNCYFPHMWALPVLAGVKKGDVVNLTGFATNKEAEEYIKSIILNEDNDTPVVFRNKDGSWELYIRGKSEGRFENEEKIKEWLEEKFPDASAYIEIIPPFGSYAKTENLTPLFVILNNLPFISQALEDYLKKTFRDHPDIDKIVDLGDLRSSIINQIHEAISPRLARRTEQIRYTGYDLLIKEPGRGFMEWTEQMYTSLIITLRPAFNTLASLEPDPLRKRVAFDTIETALKPTRAMLRAQYFGGMLYPLTLSKLSFALITQPSQQINTLCYLVALFGEKIALPAVAKQGTKTAAFYAGVARAIALYIKMLYKATASNPRAMFERMPISFSLFLEDEVGRSKLFNDVEKRILKRAIREGAISGMRLDELSISATLYFVINLLPNISEIQNRTCAVLSAVEAAQKKGITDEETIYQIARQCSYRTQYPYTLLNRPKWTRNAVGTLFYLFQSYTYNTAFLMKHLSTKRWRTVLYLAFIYWILGGIASIPVFGPVFQSIFQIFKRFFATPTLARKFHNIVKGSGLENWLWRNAIFGTAHNIGIPYTAFSATEIGRIAFWDFCEDSYRFVEGVLRRRATGAKVEPTWDLMRRFPLMPAGARAIIDFFAYQDLVLPPNPDGTPRISLQDYFSLPSYKRLELGEILAKYSAEKLTPPEQILRLIGMNPARTIFAYLANDLLRAVETKMRLAERELKREYLLLEDKLGRTQDEKEIEIITNRMTEISQKLVNDYDVSPQELRRTRASWEKRKASPPPIEGGK